MNRSVLRHSLLGKTFGRLRVVSYAGSNRGQGALWNCECSCGVSKVIPAAALRHAGRHVKGSASAGQKSCGCLQREVAAKLCRSRNNSHGHAHRGKVNATYKVWLGMKYRCGKDPDYLAVTVHPRWDQFENFLADMGEKPRGLTIERLRNSEGYAPDNCKWGTAIEQANNKGTNVFIDHEGQRMTIAEWARCRGIHYKTLYSRLFMYGWTPSRALDTNV